MIKIENIVKEKLSDFEYRSVDSDWSNFKNKLPKKKISYSKYYFVAASITIITFLSIPFINNKTEKTNIIKITNNNINKSKTIKNTNKQTTYVEVDKKKNEQIEQAVSKSNKVNVNNTEITQKNLEKDTTKNHTISNENKAIENIVIKENITSYNKKPISSFTNSANKGCTPLQIIFTADDENNNTSYFWDFGDGTISSKNKTEHIYTSPGIYKVKLTTSNNKTTEKSSFETEITVYDLPKAEFNYSVFNNTYIFEGIDCEKQIWEFGDNNLSNEINPEHIYHRIGKTIISYTVIDKHGCKSETNKEINIEPNFKIANAFSPNNDGENDKFGPIFENPKKYKYYLYIYNAYGDLIFKSQQPNQNWDGKISNSNTVANKEMYLWKLIISDKYNNRINKKGKLTIK